MILSIVILLLNGQMTFASDSNEAGGGGHIIIDENGNISPVDTYSGPTLKDFTPEQVCPADKLHRVTEFEGALADAYNAALGSIRSLAQRSRFHLLSLYFDRSNKAAKWYICDAKLPTVADHRYINLIVNGELAQLALQNSKGDIILSKPIVDVVLQKPQGKTILQVNFLHEMTLHLYGMQTDRDAVSRMVTGIFQQSDDLGPLSSKNTAGMWVRLGATVDKSTHFSIPEERLFVELENGEQRYFNTVQLYNIGFDGQSLIMSYYASKDLDLTNITYTYTPGTQMFTPSYLALKFPAKIKRLCVDKMNISQSSTGLSIPRDTTSHISRPAKEILNDANHRVDLDLEIQDYDIYKTIVHQSHYQVLPEPFLPAPTAINVPYRAVSTGFLLAREHKYVFDGSICLDMKTLVP